MSDAAWGEIVSAIALLLLTLGFTFVGRKKVWAVTADTVTYSRQPAAANSQNVSITLDRGAVIPQDDIASVPQDQRARKSISLMRTLVIGADNRTSTSKAVAFGWTYAILFGLFAIIVAKWLGDPTGYTNLVDNGLREEYW